MYALTAYVLATHPCDHEGAGLGRLYKRKDKPKSVSSCKFSFVQERGQSPFFYILLFIFCKHEDEIGGECLFSSKNDKIVNIFAGLGIQ